MKDFTVSYEGLKLGKHEFEFQMTDKFFEELEYSLVDKGDVHVTLLLEKRETMMVADISFVGWVEKPCDRCNDPLQVKVKASSQLIFKFDTVESEDEDLIVLLPSEYQLHLAPIFYELLVVALPSRSVHPKGGCNEEMMELIEEYSGHYEEDPDDDDDDDDIDPRWEALKKLN
jgi:uncharacterized metal-binding protein YceD (DUF177 family)